MRKVRIKIIIIALISIVVVSCTNRNKSMFTKDNQVEFDTLIVDEKHYLRNDTSNPFCELNVQFIYPIESSKADLKKLQQLFVRGTFGLIYERLSPKEALDQYVNNFVKNYEAEASIFHKELIELEKHPSLKPQNKDEEHDEELQSNEFYSYHETLSNIVLFNQSNILSFQVNQTNDKGGAATYSSLNNFVINLRTQELLSEEDIFAPGYDVALQQLFANNLMLQNEVNNISDLEDLGYFGIQEIMPNKNFFIDDQGITYTFNKGEYSAYPLSAPVVTIPFYDLRMLLKPNTIISKIAGLKN